jgi:chromosome-anchoring protein RacA
LNTSEVAKLLGVSVSTVKRWVKQLGLPMERNDRGHYLFTDETIQYLKFIQNQINSGILLHEISPFPEKNIRTGTVKATMEKDPIVEELASKLNSLERRLEEKADSVTSYQLLQHRREIEDLQNLVKSLNGQIEELESQLSNLKQSITPDLSLAYDQQKKMKNTKKKNIFSSLFGF